VRSRDTSRDAHRVQVEILRRMDLSERLRRALECADEGRELARSGIRWRHPEYEERDLERALRRLWLGDELYRVAFPGEPLLDP
jgi:hypothetical protein